jgi:hypothetical protein
VNIPKQGNFILLKDFSNHAINLIKYNNVILSPATWLELSCNRDRFKFLLEEYASKERFGNYIIDTIRFKSITRTLLLTMRSEKFFVRNVVERMQKNELKKYKFIHLKLVKFIKKIDLYPCVERDIDMLQKNNAFM